MPPGAPEKLWRPGRRARRGVAACDRSPGPANTMWLSVSSTGMGPWITVRYYLGEWGPGEIRAARQRSKAMVTATCQELELDRSCHSARSCVRVRRVGACRPVPRRRPGGRATARYQPCRFRDLPTHSDSQITFLPAFRLRNYYYYSERKRGQLLCRCLKSSARHLLVTLLIQQPPGADQESLEGSTDEYPQMSVHAPLNTQQQQHSKGAEIRVD